jgi:hypothetical protein
LSEHAEYEGWAILELLGHRRLAGYVTVVELAGQPMFRLDVPGQVYAGEETGQATQFVGPGSLYALTPTTEEMARAVAARNRPAPVHAWELPRPALPPAPEPAGIDAPGDLGGLDDTVYAEPDHAELDPEAIPF